MHPQTKNMLLTSALNLGLMRIVRVCNRYRGRILAYHGVVEQTDPVLNYDGFQVYEAVFRRQLEWLQQKYRVVPLKALTRSIVEGRKDMRHAVAITFDDGYANNLHVAAPILREYGMHATFFVTTGYVDGDFKPWWDVLRGMLSQPRRIPLTTGKTVEVDEPFVRIKAISAWEALLKNVTAVERTERISKLYETLDCDKLPPEPSMLSWDDVKSLVSQGFDVAPHTVSHVSVGRESFSMVEEEITRSTARFQDVAGVDPAFFAYPYGQDQDLSEEIPSLLRSLGYQGAVTTHEGFVGADSDLFMLPRLNVTSNHVGPAFEAMVGGLTYALRRHNPFGVS